MADQSVPRSQQWTYPMPALLEQVKDVTLDELHRRLDALGFVGLRFRHGHVFRFIDTDGSRVTDLAQRSGLTKQGIGDAVTELEHLGYVERHPAVDDRRAKIVRLTPRGIEGQNAAAQILEDIEQNWARRHGDAAVRQLRRVLEAIANDPSP